ncbi:Asp-tRNA(Asn)/Glu-tRNA(Gln) amidotransferase subunit GatC [Alphaproteobacteria bacterium]|nr:Asp-tRNA(Asn)/Glu-tRNA(Gln) amidotransferase subunit GatC [Alphaproteobacteria bacterium]
MTDINIKKVSYLAKLALNDDKATLYEKSLSEIIEWVDNLKKIDTEGVKPLHNITEKNHNIRNDEVLKNNSTEEILSNAPEKAQNFFRVPKVVE